MRDAARIEDLARSGAVAVGRWVRFDRAPALPRLEGQLRIDRTARERGLGAAVPDRYVLEISDARAFRDVHLAAIETFTNCISRRMGLPNLWRWERADEGRVAFRMTHAL